MADEKENSNTPKMLQNIVLVLGSLGLAGGGGGAYLLNNNVIDFQSEMNTTLAIVENNMTHTLEAVEKLSLQVIDISEGFQEEFKTHINNPGLHREGMSKLKEDIIDRIKKDIDQINTNKNEVIRRLWETISLLKDKVTTLETKIKILENTNVGTSN